MPSHADVIAATNKAAEMLNHKKNELDEFKLITERLANVKEEYARTCRDLNQKNADLKAVDNEIKSYGYTLAKMREDATREMAENSRVLEARLKEVEASSKEYTQLLRTNREKEALLENGLNNLNKERQTNAAEVKKWQIYAEGEKAEANKQLVDVQNRESLLKEEREQFETYKQSIQPEIDKMTSIKNENDLLWKKLKSQEDGLEKEREQLKRERQKLISETEASKAKIDEASLLLSKREENLAKSQQELFDYELQVKSKDAECEKILKREQLRLKAKE